MKKKWIGYWGMSVLLLLPAMKLHADIGIKAGLSLSFTGQSELFNSPSELFGSKAGIFYAIQIGEYFSIQPEISYVRKGNKYYCPVCKGIRIANLNYLEIPVVFNVHLLNKTFDLFSGVYAGILLDSVEIAAVHIWDGRDILIKKTDYGVSFGARYRFFNFLFAELQFNLGLSAAIEEINEAASKGHKNKTLSFLVGFGF